MNTLSNTASLASNPFLSNIRQYQPERKYVIFLGLGMHQSEKMKEEADVLIRNGVPAKDIILHDCPFPRCFPNFTRPWNNISNIYEYLKISNPFSPFSEKEYQKLKQELVNSQVKPSNELVFIGYSAGGQEATALSYLLANDPLMGNKIVKRIITLGTGFMSNFTPKGAELDIIDSDQDNVLKTISWDNKNPFFRSVPINFEAYPVRKHIHFRSGGHFQYIHEPRLMQGFTLAQGNWTGDITVN